MKISYSDLLGNNDLVPSLPGVVAPIQRVAGFHAKKVLVKVRHGRAHHDHRTPNFGHARRAGDWCNCLVGLQLTDAFTRHPNIPGARVESDLAEGRFQ